MPKEQNDTNKESKKESPLQERFEAHIARLKAAGVEVEILPDSEQTEVMLRLKMSKPKAKS